MIILKFQTFKQKYDIFGYNKIYYKQNNSCSRFFRTLSLMRIYLHKLKTFTTSFLKFSDATTEYFGSDKINKHTITFHKF